MDDEVLFCWVDYDEERAGDTAIYWDDYPAFYEEDPYIDEDVYPEIWFW